VQEFCRGYEAKVRAWGGVGFFLGGIGPDGHIAFNMQYSKHDR
jgi:glucosamine-6-phosphate deaminase